ncbi:NAD(P)-dependent dehydrogenase (short-subunit alcohol dehydrogenase family) [Microvirga flocculans]|uniref:NAD(P)-dependent dehydrogenase (Short-subunit alcohol dehydrogenase family) n=1 Tax=Microvirga flocculans TaxID=217168 RepID=A0A7W6ICV6_9HYPH|nr:SDR family oxidoreductase [Microvirga flocculans]MBB4039143.1 NAD(P)-dependent dehydrogenase (short-subunit alcohol dehydrogenase family) [Microvirga flocculans]
MDKAALVTGGAQRIGRRIVERLAGDGYAVAIHCRRSADEAERMAAGIRHAGGRAVIVRADLADGDAVASLVPEAVRALGPLSLLVNNASEFEPDEVETLTQERWDRHFAVNLRAPAFLARDFALQLPAEAQGSIVNIVDQRVWKLTPQFFSYTLTKAALFTATQTMAQALAPRIRVNAIGPGPTLSNVRQGDEDFAKQSSAVLLGHGGTPDEIADAVLYLAKAGSVTGQMIAVDGGQHLAWETPDVAGIRE